MNNKEPAGAPNGAGKKKGKPTALDSPRVRTVLAGLLALFAWMYVTLVVQPNTTQKITGVPVDFSYGAQTYTQQGLSIVNDPEYAVTVVASGDGYIIGSLQPEDFLVYPDYSSVKGAGESRLRLNVKCLAESGGSIKVELEDKANRVEVVFDTVDEKTLPITVVKRNVTLADGYILNKEAALPAEVTLRGPVGELENIVSAVAEISVDGELAENIGTNVPLRYLDAEGNEVAFRYVSSDCETADVTLTVYKLAQVPVSVSFINTPAGFDPSVLQYSLSQDTLTLAGPADVVDALGGISVGTIDLSTFALDKVYELPISLPSGIVSQDNVRTISVSFDSTGLATRTMNLPASCVEVVNLPNTYKLSVESARIMNVTLCGPQEVLDSLTAQNVVARIDMDDVSSIVNGQQNLAVSIYVPSSNQVFATGSYTVQCKIESD